jgi:hypothetical protein
MASQTLTGNDVLILDDHIFNDLADGDCVKLTYPNDIANVKTGKNGNSMIALDERGRQGDLEIRVLRGSTDDKFLLGKLAAVKLDFASIVLETGTFVKKLGDGLGNVQFDTFELRNGIITHQPETSDNVEGGTDQVVTVWRLRFTNVDRVLT